MKTALVLLHPGVEEAEAVTPVDLLRRAGVETTTASTADSRQVTGKTNITLTADCHLDEVSGKIFDALVIPGGPGILNLREDNRTREVIAAHDEADKIVAAICAAPLLLKDTGVLRDRPYTAHFSVHGELTAATADPVVQAENLITSQGAGTAVPFSLAIISRLLDDTAAQEVAESICWKAGS